MGGFDERLVVNHAPKEIRVLHHDQGGVGINLGDEFFHRGVDAGFRVVALNVDILAAARVGAHNLSVLWVDRTRKQEFGTFAFVVMVSQDHGFRRGSRAVVV